MKYRVVNIINEEQIPIVFNTVERAKAFMKKHNIYGYIDDIIETKDKDQRIERKQTK